MTSEEFAAARLMLDLSRNELALLLGLSSKQVHNIERGTQEAQKQTVLAVECLLRRAKLWNQFSDKTARIKACPEEFGFGAAWNDDEY